jgi:hypothetical protein
VKIPSRALSWLAFAMLCAVYYGNFYVYDSIARLPTCCSSSAA